MMKSGDESDDAFHCNHENHRNGEIDICERVPRASPEVSIGRWTMSWQMRHQSAYGLNRRRFPAHCYLHSLQSLVNYPLCLAFPLEWAVVFLAAVAFAFCMRCVLLGCFGKD